MKTTQKINFCFLYMKLSTLLKSEELINLSDAKKYSFFRLTISANFSMSSFYVQRVVDTVHRSSLIFFQEIPSVTTRYF